ncbi:hypothetical protein JHK84_042840 [Glycine max]|nr:hypothetical protein JHK84_042840 [Glycine max]
MRLWFPIRDSRFSVVEGSSFVRLLCMLLDLGAEVSPVLPPGDQGSSQVSGGSQLSSKDAFLSKVEVKTISEINGISEQMPPSIARLWSKTNEMPHVPFLSSSKFIVASPDLKEAFGSSFQHEPTV